jgi:hypothetical protein
VEKDSRRENATWQDSVAEAASLIILQSKERIWKIKGPYQSEHKAYMALALLSYEAIRAFGGRFLLFPLLTGTIRKWSA